MGGDCSPLSSTAGEEFTVACVGKRAGQKPSSPTALGSFPSAQRSLCRISAETHRKGKKPYPEQDGQVSPAGCHRRPEPPPSLPLQCGPPDVREGFTGFEALALGPESIIVDSPDSRLMAQIIGQSGPKCQFPKPERFLCSLTYHLSQTESFDISSPLPLFKQCKTLSHI